MKEEKKRTGNVRSTAENELQLQKKDREVSRNSWAEIYNETTALRKHKRLLGQEVQIDDGLEWRVKCAQRGAGSSALLTCICFVARQIIATIVFGAIYFNIYWYIVLQKLLVRYCETLVARNQGGDNFRICSVQL